MSLAGVTLIRTVYEELEMQKDKIYKNAFITVSGCSHQNIEIVYLIQN